MEAKLKEYDILVDEQPLISDDMEPIIRPIRKPLDDGAEMIPVPAVAGGGPDDRTPGPSNSLVLRRRYGARCFRFSCSQAGIL